MAHCDSITADRLLAAGVYLAMAEIHARTPALDPRSAERHDNARRAHDRLAELMGGERFLRIGYQEIEKDATGDLLVREFGKGKTKAIKAPRRTKT